MNSIKSTYAGISLTELTSPDNVSQELLYDENAILKGMLASSTDACWCIEFTTQIDLTAPDREVIRQVFENGPFWRFCNDAMARLYWLPPHLDFNSRPVSEIFPRNKDNEQFIQQLIKNGFELNAVPALDTRYDGVSIYVDYVENDVRAHVALKVAGKTNHRHRLFPACSH